MAATGAEGFVEAEAMVAIYAETIVDEFNQQGLQDL